MPRPLFRLGALAALVSLPLAGCDTYGLDDDPGTGPPPGQNPPTQNPPANNPDGLDLPALAAALGCDAVGRAQMNGAVGGSLVEGDCTLEAGRFPLYDGGEYLDAYAFRLADTTAVRLDLDAGAFDPVLILLDDAMELVAYNDDRVQGEPAPDENSTIEITLAPGVYVAVATSFFVGERGTYALTLSER